MTFVSASALLLTSIHRPGCVEASTEQGSGPVQLYRELQLRLGRVRGAAGALHPAGGGGGGAGPRAADRGGGLRLAQPPHRAAGRGPAALGTQLPRHRQEPALYR